MENHLENVCLKHSGVCSDMVHLKQSDESQWKEINSMKTRNTVMLTATILTLLGVIGNIVVLLVRVPK